MNRLHLFFTLGIAATAAACSDDEGTRTAESASLAHTRWEAQDTARWMDVGVHPIIGTYRLSLGESDFLFDVKEVAAGQPCFGRDTAYQLKGSYLYEPPKLSLRSEGGVIEATVSPRGEISLATEQNDDLTLKPLSD